MSQAEKAQLRLRVLLKQTAIAHGDVAKTAGSFANRMRRLSAETTNTSAVLGTALLPITSTLIGALVPIVNAIGKWAEENPRLSKAIFIVVSALGALLLVGGLALIVFGQMAIALSALGISFTLALGPISLIILAIVAVVAAGILLYTHWDTVKKFAVNTFNTIKDTVVQQLRPYHSGHIPLHRHPVDHNQALGRHQGRYSGHLCQHQVHSAGLHRDDPGSLVELVRGSVLSEYLRGIQEWH